MTIASQTIGSDETLRQAQNTMVDHGLSHLPVVDAGKVVGVISQRELHLLETIGGVDLDVGSVTDSTLLSVYRCHPEDSLRDVARIMAARTYGCAVVVDRGAVLGIFTATDALACLAAALA
ncbi:MAG TPA: CBS domain-containing protein [Labilithrix sp.]|jgi:acetoin utilization protein AcuB|nr:CBS domain-containing protein [Labilithrix sp.]